MSAAESSISAAGPVGLIAVTAGIGGLVYGLVRRRKAVPVAPQNQRVVSDVEQV
ncbi:hypothetical protein [Lentzea tibetensis]|uniref:hypothetical protein n=1 Tax=Lentzea tibetensis TaxID=2591470 RepID=UPI001648138A|nr:hypothetical protein [Lentzea tibetensis]